MDMSRMSTKAMQLAEDEWQALKGCDHLNIVKFIDQFKTEADQKWYLVQQVHYDLFTVSTNDNCMLFVDKLFNNYLFCRQILDF